jgi:hypothetical protein
MTAPVVFNLQSAQEALARSDDGADPLPGDASLIDAHEVFCQQEQDRLDAELLFCTQTEWLALQCPACEEGGTGPVCDECCDEPEVAA